VQSNAIADTGCTGHYINPNTPQTIIPSSPHDHPTVTLPDNSTIKATHSSTLPFPHQFSREATLAHSFPQMAQPLISIGKLCDDGFTAIFTNKKCYIVPERQIKHTHFEEQSVLTGTRNTSTKLWYFDLHRHNPAPTPSYNANTVYELKTRELVQFLHKACFSPTKHTWLQAIKKGHFATWPNLNYKLVNKFLDPSLATAKGHLKQQRQNYRSTKLHTSNIAMTVSAETRENDIFIKSLPIQGLLCTDQTGAFPITSNKGNKYIMVAHHATTNAVLVQPMPSRSQQHLLIAFKRIYNRLIDYGHKPSTIRLDNEAPKNLKKFFQIETLSYQLVPPHNHRRNYAERAIGIFKDHFISGLASLNPSFPLNLWCRLLPHAEDTLNLLRTSNLNPNISSYAELYGQFDYNATPIFPPGLKILIHEKPSQRSTWSPRGVEGWYLGPSKEHYRCHRVYCTQTNAERITDTMEIFPHQQTPTASMQEAAIIATEQLTSTIQEHKGTIGNEQLDALQQLAAVFSKMAKHDKQKQYPILPQLPRNVPVRSTPSRASNRTTTHQVPPIRHSLPQPNVPQVARHRPTLAPRHHNRIVPHTQLQENPQANNQPVTETRVPAHSHTNTQPVTQTRVRTNSHSYNLRKHRTPNPRYAHTCIPTHSCNAVFDTPSGQMLEFKQLVKKYPKIWIPSMSNEFGRLLNGVGTRMPKGSETIEFIPPTDIPSHKTITYARIVCDYRPLKSEPNRTRLTVGGDRLTCSHETSTDAADLILIKLFFNSVLSTKNAKFLSADIKDFYLANNRLLAPEFMKISVEYVPPEIIQQYNLTPLIRNGWLYIKINKGMYGLKQAGYIAHQNLKKHLAKYGYYPCKHTRGLWLHESRDIQFILVVDDFGIKYTNNEDKEHLLHALRDRYTISIDSKGTNYCGLTLMWDYPNRSLEISMPTYIPNLLEHLKFQQSHRENSPHTHTIPVYGQKVQYEEDKPPLPPLNTKETKEIQHIVGSLLYYARAVDPTLLVALGSLASQQNAPTSDTTRAITQILNYVATHPLAVIKYTASPMVLRVHSDASYLSEKKARSRAGGHFFLSNLKSSLPNGPVHTVSNIMRNVMASAAEAEIGAVFTNAQTALPIRQALQDLGHKQPPTPVRTDNSTAFGFLNETIKAKRTKAIDMRFYWTIDRIKQGHFYVYWRPGSENLGDYHSKHHPPSHHSRMRKQIFNSAYHASELIDILRGCNNTLLFTSYLDT